MPSSSGQRLAFSYFGFVAFLRMLLRVPDLVVLGALFAASLLGAIQSLVTIRRFRTVPIAGPVSILGRNDPRGRRLDAPKLHFHTRIGWPPL
jgi:hypothetical protein